MKKILYSLLAVLLFVPALVFAAEFRSGNYPTVGRGENPKNLYTAGQTVTVDGNVASDLVAAGSIVNVNGNVENTAELAGGTINLKGNVGKSARVAGGTILVDGDLGEDLVVFGGQVNVNSGSVISGDLIVYGGTVDMNGTVNGKINGGGGTVNINGTVGQSVTLGDSGEVRVGPNARINGDLNYRSPREANIASGAQISGRTNYTRTTDRAAETAGLTAGAIFFTLAMAIGSFLLLLLIIYLAPGFSLAFVARAFDSVWANLGIGFLALIAIPVGIIILAITVVGLPIAGFVLLAYIVYLVLTKILADLLVGSLILKWIQKGAYQVNWKAAAIGVIVMTLVSLIPIVGWFVAFVIFLIAFGALITLSTRAVRTRR